VSRRQNKEPANSSCIEPSWRHSTAPHAPWPESGSSLPAPRPDSTQPGRPVQRTAGGGQGSRGPRSVVPSSAPRLGAVRPSPGPQSTRQVKPAVDYSSTNLKGWRARILRPAGSRPIDRPPGRPGCRVQCPPGSPSGSGSQTMRLALSQMRTRRRPLGAIRGHRWIARSEPLPGRPRIHPGPIGRQGLAHRRRRIELRDHRRIHVQSGQGCAHARHEEQRRRELPLMGRRQGGNGRAQRAALATV
jgi:hypothetical protein